ncbi:melatonin receptor type 1B-B-like [Haliotis cracherodii]|uniref:melatonin receptor type 1B-B-like n=1 Tax=Haliotis cracherodii TaxID=6455 RepID=UPI0039EBB631
MPSVGNITYRDNNVNILLAALASTLSVTAIILNSLLIYVICRAKYLHTCTNCFLVSLSVAELLVAVFAVPWAAVARIHHSWACSNTFCTVSGFLYNVGRNGAAYSLVMVCLDRCVAVSTPLKYNNIITSRTALMLTMFAWSQSTLIALVPFFGKGLYTFVGKFSLCMLLGDSHSSHMLFKELFGCVLPAFVIAVMLAKIAKEATSHHRVFAILPAPRLRSSLRPGHYGRNTLKAMRALFTIILAYAVFCIPLSIVKIVHQTCCSHLPEALVTSLVWLSFLCCVINPVVIATMNKKFKQSFMTLVCSCMKPPRSQDKEGFTITSGLHTVLDASLVSNILHNSDTFRRHTLSKLSTQPDVVGKMQLPQGSVLFGTPTGGPIPGTSTGGPIPGTPTRGPIPGTPTGGPISGTPTGGPIPGTSTGGPIPGTSIGGPTPGTSIGGPIPGTSIGGPTPGTSIGGPIPETSIGGPIPGTSIGGPIPGTSIGGPIPETSTET